MAYINGTISSIDAATYGGAALPAFDADEATDFLTLLGGAEAQERGLDPLAIPHSWVAIEERGVSKGEGAVEPKFGTLAAMTPWLKRKTAEGCAVFVAVNRFDGRGRKARDCVGLRALVLDCDDGVPDVSAFPLMPSMIVTRGHPDKAHFYWLLKDTAIEHAARWAALQQSLIANYNGDAAVKDVSRAMRIPGSANFKDGAAPVRFEYNQTGDGSCPAYTLAELEAAFPPVVRAASPTPDAKPSTKSATAPLPAAILAILAQAKTAPRRAWATPPVVISLSIPAVLARAESAVEHLGPAVRGYAGGGQGERDAWIGIGFALAGGVAKDELSDDDGLELFKRFSAYGGDDADDDDAIEARWRGFNATGEKGLGSLFREAARHGWTDPAKALVAVAAGTRIEDIPAHPLPAGFAVKTSTEGEWIVDQGPNDPAKASGDTFVVPAIAFIARTRTDDGRNWGRIIRIRQSDGNVLHDILPDAVAAEDRGLRSWLAERGVTPAAGKKPAGALRYLFDRCRPTRHVRRVDQLGWRESSSGLSFVLPDSTIGDASKELVVFGGAKTGVTASSGSLLDWQENVARPMVGNRWGLLALGVALSGPLLRLASERGSVWHFVGSSSKGKSTLLAVAGSVWSPGAVVKWDATSVGLETHAAAMTDTFLGLDELGANRDGAMVASALYALADGVGRARGTKDIGARETLRWNVPVLSTGEKSFATHISETTGGRLKLAAGQSVRGIEMRVDQRAHGAFDVLPLGVGPGAFAKGLDRAAKTFYGVAGRAFVSELVRAPDDAKRALAGHKNAFAGIVATGVGQVGAQQGRVAAAFGLVHAALMMAVEVGVLPFAAREVDRVAFGAFESWIAEAGRTGDRESSTSIETVDGWLAANAARFLPWPSATTYAGAPVRDAAGYIRRNSHTSAIEAYAVFSQVFANEVATGAEPRTVLRALRDAGRLDEQPSRRGKTVVLKAGPSMRVQVYVIKA